MRKRWIAVLMAVFLLLGTAAAAAEDTEVDWTAERRAKLKVGNTTELRGCFFTTMWGGETSDLDVQDLLHGYSLVRYDHDTSRFLFDESVVEDSEILDDTNGDRLYLIVLNEELKWSDGTPITAYDYAFSVLLCMDPVIAQTGGSPMDFSWISGAEEYLNHEAETLSGLKVHTDNILSFRAKADALPYFFERSRMMIRPYPIQVIAPGLSVTDEGEGVHLSAPLTEEMIRETVLDPNKGYLTYPSVVSGPYTLESFDGVTAKFLINPYFIGTWDGFVPRIGEVEYTLAYNQNMVEKLKSGEFDLLDKVTMAESIHSGIRALTESPDTLAMESEPRVGLTLVWFREDSPKVQEFSVRAAIACCFDRDEFIRQYVGPFGLRADGLYGLAQWPYMLEAGVLVYPESAENRNTDQEEIAYDEDVLAWQGVSPEGLTTYKLNTEAAVRLLEKAGWNLNENGQPFDAERDKVRYKETAEGLTGLDLKMVMPGSVEAQQALETCFAAHLREAGIGLTITRVSMEELEDAYHGEYREGLDLLYVGENFSIFLDPGLLAPQTDADTPLHSVKEELYELAKDMVRTSPNDLEGFMRKWLNVQVRITETLPLIPVYTNTYFDFYKRTLHNYRIERAVTWGEAITKSYMSDIEQMSEEEKEEEQRKLLKLEREFEEIRAPGPKEQTH